MEAITLLSLGRLGPQIASFARAQVDPMDETLLAFRIKNIGIRRIEHDLKSVAAFQRSPIGIANPFLARHLARAGKTFIILQSSRNPIIGLRIIHRDPVKLARRDAVEMFPAFPAA